MKSPFLAQSVASSLPLPSLPACSPTRRRWRSLHQHVSEGCPSSHEPAALNCSLAGGVKLTLPQAAIPLSLINWLPIVGHRVPGLTAPCMPVLLGHRSNRNSVLYCGMYKVCRGSLKHLESREFDNAGLNFYKGHWKSRENGKWFSLIILWKPIFATSGP